MALCGVFAGCRARSTCSGGSSASPRRPHAVPRRRLPRIAVALLGRDTATGTAAAALLFGALVSGTSQRNLDPTIFAPELAGNLTIIIQGLVVLFVSADVIVLG